MAAILVVGGLTAMLLVLLVGDDTDNKVNEVSLELAFVEPQEGDSCLFDAEKYRGADIRVELNINGNFDRVEIHLDGEKVDEILYSPFVCEVDEVARGSHLIEAVAYDDGDKVLASEQVSIEVLEETGQEVSSGGAQEQPPVNTTSPATPEPEAQDLATFPLEQYSNPTWAFTISYPKDWARFEEDRSYGHRTKWWSPDGAMYFLVDSSPLAPNETDPAENPRVQHSNFEAGDASYINYGISSETFKGYASCRWEFSYTSPEEDFFPGQTIRKFDYFVVGESHGYAILFAARPDTYGENLQTFIDEILASFEPDV